MPSPHETKELVPQGIYHAFNRGVEKRRIFVDGYDYQRFLGYIRQGFANEPGITLLAYSLMPNHFHLLIRQSDEPNAISRFMQGLGISYVRTFNNRHNRVGPLYQGKYKAVRVVGPEHLMSASRYIHLNPLNAGLGWWHYQYSSVDAYLPPFPANPLVDPSPVLELFDSPADYQRFLYAQLRAGAKNFQR
jgi:REP element-mobilizing transposase RayT